jgi:RNA polymerase sigma-70 factor (ECF subfamily)
MFEDPHGGSIADESLAIQYARDPDGAAGRAALAMLIERWSGRVYVWAYRIVREREQALDLSQDCLVRMIGALPRYEPRGRFPAWLFTIVHNRCRSALSHSRWQVDPEVEVDLLISDGAGPEGAYESAESERRILDVMLGTLDERERLALWLRAEEGMSVEDITRLMGIDSASGARGLLQTARRKLRAALAPGIRDERGGP